MISECYFFTQPCPVFSSRFFLYNACVLWKLSHESSFPNSIIYHLIILTMRVTLNPLVKYLLIHGMALLYQLITSPFLSLEVLNTVTSSRAPTWVESRPLFRVGVQAYIIERSFLPSYLLRVGGTSIPSSTPHPSFPNYTGIQLHLGWKHIEIYGTIVKNN